MHGGAGAQYSHPHLSQVDAENQNRVGSGSHSPPAAVKDDEKYFTNVDMQFYHLFTLAAVPLRNTSLFEPVLGILEKIDNVVLSIPSLKWQAWQTVFVLSGPEK